MFVPSFGKCYARRQNKFMRVNVSRKFCMSYSIFLYHEASNAEISTTLLLLDCVVAAVDVSDNADLDCCCLENDVTFDAVANVQSSVVSPALSSFTSRETEEDDPEEYSSSLAV